MSDEATTPGPGWYPDPTTPGRQRYWDGTQWTDWTDDTYAQRAGTTPGTGVGVSSWPSEQPAATGHAGQPWVAAQPRTNGLAIGSLVTGIIALVACVTSMPVGVILGPIAIVLSVRSRRVIKADASQTGNGLATAGMVTGIIGTLIGIALAIFWIAVLNDPLFWEEFNRGLNS